MSAENRSEGHVGAGSAEAEAGPDRSESSNIVKSTVLLAKAVIGAGVAAVPLTDAMLGWPLALAFLLLMAYATYASLNILVRAISAEGSTSYPEVTKKLLGRWAGMLLEIAIAAFSVGLMLVYCVVIGDMLVGKKGFEGLLCGPIGGLFCSRPFVVGIVTLIILVPAISFRSMEATAFAGWIGMGALVVWAIGTLVLLIAAIAKNKVVRDVRLLPDRDLLGGGGIRMVANICAVIPVLTTAYSCQMTAPFVLAELRPSTAKTMRQVTAAAITITTVIYALISLGSYLVFGRGTQADVLQNYHPSLLVHIVPHWLADVLYIVVRLSFLLGVLTLFPLMMFPARDSLIRIFSRRRSPLPALPHYVVTYGICLAVYLISTVTPSIYGPIQIIGATAGAVIGFVIPGLLFFLEPATSPETEELLESQRNTGWRWTLKSVTGWLLLVIGIVQSITGIASQALQPRN